MMQTVIENKQLNEQYLKIKHQSGLTILLCPMKGYSSSYALFGTNYGSIDSKFKTSDQSDFTTVPAGIAHFLEHKLFESEDKDAFERYAQTGASANAYTSFDKTCYLFSCTDHFKESLDILLDFVTSPYFTEQTVQKEQGIIGQEIRMYDDDPGWQVYFNLLRAMYQKHPIRTDIAGTVESISKITAQTLYDCYHTFYNLNNMVLTIAGNFTVEEVLESADRILKKSDAIEIVRAPSEEPEKVGSHEIIASLPVSQPLFQIGFKEKIPAKDELAQKYVLHSILLELLAGEASPLYRELYDQGLISGDFGTEIMLGRDYMCTIFAGECKDPKRVRQALCDQIDQMKNHPLDLKQFECQKKALYGRYVRSFSNVEGVAGAMIDTYFLGLELYDLVNACANVTYTQANEYLKQILNQDKMVLSVIQPSDK